MTTFNNGRISEEINCVFKYTQRDRKGRKDQAVSITSRESPNPQIPESSFLGYEAGSLRSIAGADRKKY